MPAWLCDYNNKRPHSSLAGKPPIARPPKDNVLGKDTCGLRLAVKVVLFNASSVATLPRSGGSGLSSDMRRENCPLAMPAGSSATSKQRARARAALWACKDWQMSRT
jgi:hypothetical protein